MDGGRWKTITHKMKMRVRNSHVSVLLHVHWRMAWFHFNLAYIARERGDVATYVRETIDVTISANRVRYHYAQYECDALTVQPIILARKFGNTPCNHRYYIYPTVRRV